MMTEKDNWLPFTNDFIFSMVLRDPEICKGLLNRILPQEEFSSIQLGENKYTLFSDEPLSIELQKTLKFGPDTHGVRFDAFVKNRNTWAEIEMQAQVDEHIGKRSRYYHANMDMDFLDSGKPYKSLKKSYVIFICTFDYMKQGEALYFFQNYDLKNEIAFDDDSYTIILNTSCPPEKVPKELVPLYAYICNRSLCLDDPFIKQLDSQVRKYNTPEWRQKQMTIEGFIERAERRALERVNKLNELLLEAGRTEDIFKAIRDPEYQEKLFKEFEL